MPGPTQDLARRRRRLGTGAAVRGLALPAFDQAPTSMRVRRQTAGHPFGTLKAWVGATRFLTRTLKRVSTEMSLHVRARDRPPGCPTPDYGHPNLTDAGHGFVPRRRQGSPASIAAFSHDLHP